MSAVCNGYKQLFKRLLDSDLYLLLETREGSYGKQLLRNQGIQVLTANARITKLFSLGSD